MGVILSNNTYKRYERAVDKVLKPSIEELRPLPNSHRSQVNSFELSGNQTETMSSLEVGNGGQVVEFSQATILRPRWQGEAGAGRGLPTIASASGGLINIRTSALVEMSWVVSVRSKTTGGLDLWMTTIEQSDDNGATYTAATASRSSAYNYHADEYVSIVCPPCKFQVLPGDIWRVRLWSIVNTAGGGSTAEINDDGTLFTIRTI